MNKILEKRQLSANVWRMKLEAPLIARERKAGQFVIVQVVEEFGERIPLTIGNASAEEGWIEIIFQTVGETTMKLSRREVGEYLPAVTGPLGRPTDITNYSTADRKGWVVVVGGGIGVAPSHPIVQAFHAAGNRVTMIMGARTKELIIMEEEMRRAADEVVIVTDDGSYGRKGLVTEPLKEFCEMPEKPDEVVIIGPPVMMKLSKST